MKASWRSDVSLPAVSAGHTTSSAKRGSSGEHRRGG
jgi:hypothetical protein